MLPVTRTPMCGMVCQFEAAVTLFHPCVRVYDSGVGYLQNYHTDNDRTICHDENSHASGAFCTYADAVTRGLVAPHRGYDRLSVGKLSKQSRTVTDYLD